PLVGPDLGVVRDRCNPPGAAVDAGLDAATHARRAERTADGGAVDVPQALHVSPRAPLALLIESIEEVLGVFEGRQLFAGVGPNPFHRDPRYRWSTPGFRQATACHHDITLLQSQLAGLRELSAGLDRW